MPHHDTAGPSPLGQGTVCGEERGGTEGGRLGLDKRGEKGTQLPHLVYPSAHDNDVCSIFPHCLAWGGVLLAKPIPTSSQLHTCSECVDWYMTAHRTS